jgi:hypothetical protein
MTTVCHRGNGPLESAGNKKGPFVKKAVENRTEKSSSIKKAIQEQGF